MKTIKIEKNHVRKLIGEALGEVLYEQGDISQKREEWKTARGEMVRAGQALKPPKKWNEINNTDGEAWQKRLKARKAFIALQKAKGTMAKRSQTKEPTPETPEQPAQGFKDKKTGESSTFDIKNLLKPSEPMVKAYQKLNINIGNSDAPPWCNKQNLNPVEQMICKSPGLRMLENTNRQLYKLNKDPNKKAGIGPFLKKRDACKDVACVAREYIDRIHELYKGIPELKNIMSAAGGDTRLDGGTSVDPRPQWAVRLNSKNMASSKQCPPIWVPARRRNEVFLEKAEKEELVFYHKYPNREPDGWRQELRKNMRIRESGLFSWVKRYSKVKSNGKLELKPKRIENMIFNSGAWDREGRKKMQLNLQKMIDCEIEYINSPAYKKRKQNKLDRETKAVPPNVSPTPGAGGRPAKQPPRP